MEDFIAPDMGVLYGTTIGVIKGDTRSTRACHVFSCMPTQQ